MSENSIILENKRLKVEIAVPGTVYAKSRFDWTGFITQVTLDGAHTFCGYESIIPGEGTGGIGLCNDFGLNTPVGYEEAFPGEGYMKIGIGTVEKYDNRPGDSTHGLDLRILKKAKIDWKTGRNYVEFECDNPEVNGYSCELTKKISVNENRLTVDYVLKNTGKKKIVTEEYIHNFLCLDGNYIGRDYELELALNLGDDLMAASKLRQPQMTFKKGVIGFSGTFDKKAFYLKGFDVKEDPKYSFRLSHKTSGLSITEKNSCRMPYMALWGTKYVISPEAFMLIELEPKKKLKWSREYTFESGK